MRRRGEWTQLSFEDLPRHGGKRRGAGRKLVGRAGVEHRVRPVMKWWNPMLVTLRAISELPTFRSPEPFGVIEGVVRQTQCEEFRICEFSVQRDHLHLLVEATDQEALSRAMRSFVIRAALRLNRQFKRSGPVWGDRYHRRDLTSPRQVRNALLYVLQNYKKHHRIGPGRLAIDPFSSAAWFDGWALARALPTTPRPTSRPQTMLLSTLWKRHGLLHPAESPLAA